MFVFLRSFLPHEITPIICEKASCCYRYILATIYNVPQQWSEVYDQLMDIHLPRKDDLAFHSLGTMVK